MLITKHGNKREAFYKGVSAFNNERGKPLVFFGYKPGQVRLKEAMYLLKHHPVSESRLERKPLLRLVVSK